MSFIHRLMLKRFGLVQRHPVSIQRDLKVRMPDGAVDERDGLATIEWIKQQPWYVADGVSDCKGPSTPGADLQWSISALGAIWVATNRLLAQLNCTERRSLSTIHWRGLLWYSCRSVMRRDAGGCLRDLSPSSSYFASIRDALRRNE